MFVLGLTLFLAILLVLTAVLSFRWAVKDGQLDDLDTPPLRMLADDARPRVHPARGRVAPPTDEPKG